MFFLFISFFCLVMTPISNVVKEETNDQPSFRKVGGDLPRETTRAARRTRYRLQP